MKDPDRSNLIWALHDEALTLNIGVQALTQYLVQTGYGHLAVEALREAGK